jgi:hypothetical protein
MTPKDLPSQPRLRAVGDGQVAVVTKAVWSSCTCVVHRLRDGQDATSYRDMAQAFSPGQGTDGHGRPETAGPLCDLEATSVPQFSYRWHICYADAIRPKLVV